ncbi:MAG TPA: imidazoleglycerol-phosphate dehydratase HisB [Candidatus Enterocloster faecavium]|uniref:Imidazoleglycerol-phosphate dehydratase n=1 Tax=Candidatus Enterocloster faecavium TaxID=2838560 RepID=A0A9D2L7V0_9FIRM|nr:imidazoleglycerol-phosphate dehydratase HisB [Candidatus Enterocloster faecavium]
MERLATIHRVTKETDISLTLNLDGSGKASIETGIGFFDHMLGSFARHGFFDLDLKVQGDLQVDTHHTVEDVGIVLGQAILQAAGDKAGICRFGSQILPMDESLILCSLDLCGRPYLGYDLKLDRERVGDFETEMAREFFYAVSYGAMMNLHLRQLAGENCHHILEAAFKAFGRALDAACGFDSRIHGVLSTKGTL